VRRQFVLKISRPLAVGTRCGMIEGDPTIFRLKQILVDTLKAGVLKTPDEKPQ
jgi:hypothetical protein